MMKIHGQSGILLRSLNLLDVDMLTRMKINQYLHRRKLSMEAA